MMSNTTTLDKISFLFSDGSQTTISADKFKEIYEKLGVKESSSDNIDEFASTNTYTRDTTNMPYEYQHPSHRYDDPNFGCR